MGSKTSKRKPKKEDKKLKIETSSKSNLKGDKLPEIQTPLKSKQEEKDKDNSKRNIKKLKHKDFDISKIELKSKILSLNDNLVLSPIIDIFPNGNILFFDFKTIRIYDSKILRPLFAFTIENVKDIIILSNNTLLLLIYSYETSLNTLKIFNFSKGKTEFKKTIDITIKSYNNVTKDIDDDFLYENEHKLDIQKLNNNYILSYYLERTGIKDEYFIKFRDFDISPDVGRTPYKYYFMFYKYIDNDNDLILKYEDSHELCYFEHDFLPYEDAFFFYGNSSYCYYSNPIVDICFLYFYRNKKMKCLIDGIEHERINRCIIFDEKYLIVQFYKKIKKYLILNDNISSVSEYYEKYYEGFNFLIYNQFNIIFIQIEEVDKNKYMHLLEVDDNYKKIKEAKILIGNDYVYKILYNKKLYLLTNNLNIYY